LQVLKVEIEIFFVGQREAKFVLALAAVASLRALPAALLRPRDGIAFDVLLVARQNVIAHAALTRTMQMRFVHAAARDRNFAAFAGILDRTARRRLTHCLAH